MEKGFQLYSVRDKCTDAKGLERTVFALAEMGYEGLEFFEYQGIGAQRLRRILSDAGLRGFNAHVGYERLYTRFEAEVEYAAQAGFDGIIIPFIPEEARTEEGYGDLLSRIPQWADRCQAHGLTLTYHNHAFEYAPYRDGTLLDAVMASDPRLGLELDTYWAFHAGSDVLADIEAFRPRIRYIQLKDYLRRNGEAIPDFCAVGHGLLDPGPYIQAARGLELEWIVVEQDNSAIDTLESARLSLQTLKNYGL